MGGGRFLPLPLLPEQLPLGSCKGLEKGLKGPQKQDLVPFLETKNKKNKKTGSYFQGNEVFVIQSFDYYI